MFLHTLRIENFRAIGEATIHFDDGTALIGENDCGISSVLDALELALNGEEEPEAWPAWLFHHSPGSASPAGSIRFELRFRERSHGEWDDADHAPFRDVLPKRTNQQRELWFEMSIKPGTEGKTVSRFSLSVGGPGRIRL